MYSSTHEVQSSSNGTCAPRPGPSLGCRAALSPRFLFLQSDFALRHPLRSTPLQSRPFASSTLLRCPSSSFPQKHDPPLAQTTQRIVAPFGLRVNVTFCDQMNTHRSSPDPAASRALRPCFPAWSMTCTHQNINMMNIRSS